MPDVDLTDHRVAVLASAFIYWAGVFVQTRRVRRKIGRAPNVRPRGLKENLLWIGWLVVVLAWFSLPLVSGAGRQLKAFRLIEPLCNRASFWGGMVLIIAGYAGTLWCYASMGSTWRMGVNRSEKTRLVREGPFRFIRHPIYVFQAVMLAGASLLLPTMAIFGVLALHIICIMAKAADEEDYLRTLHGAEYANYLSHTGRFIPKLRFKSK